MPGRVSRGDLGYETDCTLLLARTQLVSFWALEFPTALKLAYLQCDILGQCAVEDAIVHQTASRQESQDHGRKYGGSIAHVVTANARPEWRGAKAGEMQTGHTI